MGLEIVDGKVWLLLWALVAALLIAACTVYGAARREVAARRRVRFRCVSCLRWTVRQCATDAEAVTLLLNSAPKCAPCQGGPS